MAFLESSHPLIASPARLWLSKSCFTPHEPCSRRSSHFWGSSKELNHVFESFRPVKLGGQGRPETQRLAHAHVVAPERPITHRNDE